MAHFTVHIFICVCVYLCFFVSYCIVLYHCEQGGVDLIGLKPNPLDLSSFSALTLLVGSFDPQKAVSDMTYYNVFGGTLSLTQSINFQGHGVKGRDDHRHLVNLMDPELLKGLEPKLEQILTVVGIRTCHVLKVIGSKVKVISVQVCQCYNGLMDISVVRSRGSLGFV